MNAPVVVRYELVGPLYYMLEAFLFHPDDRLVQHGQNVEDEREIHHGEADEGYAENLK